MVCRKRDIEANFKLFKQSSLVLFGQFVPLIPRLTQTVKLLFFNIKTNKMKYLKSILVMTIFLSGISMTSKAEEITLFNSVGEAIAYIDADDDDLTIYLWNGTPVAYLDPSGDAFDIYGFNGKHLGWFEDGIVRDHEGYGVGFQKGATSIYTKYEPYKSYKQYKPYKSYKEYAPYKPYYKTQFSGESLSLFLSKGKK
jgi:hypothetical protein